MTGTKNRIATQIKKLNEKCLLPHCYCHTLNIDVGDTIKNIPLLRATLDMTYEIIKLIKKSPDSEAEFHRKHTKFLGHMESDFHLYDMESPTLQKPRPNMVESLSGIP